MKKFILSAVIATTISITAFADGIKKSSADNGEENVAYATLTQFKSDFENVSDVTWTVSKTSQKATFTQNNTIYTAYYDTVGEYWGLAHVVTLNNVEKQVKANLAKNYAGFKVESITRFDSQNEDPAVYFINVKNAAQALVLTVTAYDGEVKSIEKVK
ncbi:hypothetical protein [Mucilaginibacter antarcticus]|uniref:PepSY-like beta-lactamase-inhibitor n=1 Tax=Mucilaginibacter antarcticus TaxID=1855725 RepID=A0ABW5XUX1_9SPHI